MRPVTLILALAVGLPLAAATAGCERDRTRVEPAQKTIEDDTTVIEREADTPDIELHPDTRTQPPAEPAAGPEPKAEADVDRDDDDDLDVDLPDDVDVEGDVDTTGDDVKLRGGVDVKDE